MANTYVLLGKATLTSTATTISVTSIPATYDDLVVLTSLRSDRSGQLNSSGRVKFNSSTTNYSWINSIATGQTLAKDSNTTQPLIYIPAATATSSVFSNDLLYITSYKASVGKAIRLENGFAFSTNVDVFAQQAAVFWNDTNAIASITLDEANGANFVANSTMYVYGIKRT